MQPAIAMVPDQDSTHTHTHADADASPMLFKITAERLSSDDLYEHVRHNGCGAVATFCGVVRDNSGTKRTDYLEYEAYPEMAENKMAELGAEAKAMWDIADIAILHRVGRLEVGEISVLIAVASPHRGAAFEACHWAIDRLKETVPIWKKEVGEDGQYWVEGPTTSTTAAPQRESRPIVSQVTNFSWLVPGVLAGLAHPGGPSYDADMDQAGLCEAFAFLREQGIGAIVSLTEYPLDSTTVEACGFEYLQRPIPDMVPPSIDDIEAFVEFVDKASIRGIGVGVHCLAGLGRTGTMLACYLVSKGEDASAAVARVRRERPGSVETPAQEEVVLDYARHAEALNKA